MASDRVARAASRHVTALLFMFLFLTQFAAAGMVFLYFGALCWVPCQLPHLLAQSRLASGWNFNCGRKHGELVESADLVHLGGLTISIPSMLWNEVPVFLVFSPGTVILWYMVHGDEFALVIINFVLYVQLGEWRRLQPKPACAAQGCEMCATCM